MDRAHDVKEVLALHFNKQIEEIESDQKLESDLGADSFDLIEMVIELETRLGIVIPDDEAENFSTVQDVIDCVENL